MASAVSHMQESERAFAAKPKIKKSDIAELQRAYDGKACTPRGAGLALIFWREIGTGGFACALDDPGPL